MAFWNTYESLEIHILLNCSFLSMMVLWLTANVVTAPPKVTTQKGSVEVFKSLQQSQ